MNNISPTTVIGILKYLLITICALAYLFDFATAGKVALVMAFFNGALSGAGFYYARDARSSEPEGLERKI